MVVGVLFFVKAVVGYGLFQSLGLVVALVVFAGVLLAAGLVQLGMPVPD